MSCANSPACSCRPIAVDGLMMTSVLVSPACSCRPCRPIAVDGLMVTSVLVSPACSCRPCIPIAVDGLMVTSVLVECWPIYVQADLHVRPKPGVVWAHASHPRCEGMPRPSTVWRHKQWCQGCQVEMTCYQYSAPVSNVINQQQNINHAQKISLNSSEIMIFTKNNVSWNTVHHLLIIHQLLQLLSKMVEAGNWS
jgi:hypothetical protein